MRRTWSSSGVERQCAGQPPPPRRSRPAEAGQPERDLAEQGGDLVWAVILDLARGSAGANSGPSIKWSRRGATIPVGPEPTSRSPCNRVQTQIRTVTDIKNFFYRHHVDAPARSLDNSTRA